MTISDLLKEFKDTGDPMIGLLQEVSEYANTDDAFLQELEDLHAELEQVLQALYEKGVECLRQLLQEWKGRNLDADAGMKFLVLRRRQERTAAE